MLLGFTHPVTYHLGGVLCALVRTIHNRAMYFVFLCNTSSDVSTHTQGEPRLPPRGSSVLDALGYYAKWLVRQTFTSAYTDVQ